MGANSILKYAALFAICLSLFSCKRKVELVLEEYTPLSKKASDLSANAQWAYELESGRLEKKINSFESIDKSVSLLPISVTALEGGYPMSPVYPELEGFGSLDTSSIQGELFDTVKDFCLGIVEYSNKLKLVKDYEASVKENLGKVSEKKEQAKDGEEEETEIPKKDSSKIDALFARRSIFSLALFLNDCDQAGVLESFVIGRPLVGEESMEVPVLFYGQKKKLYSKLYPIQEGQGWKIQQIEIYKTEENNGSGETDRD